MSKSNEIKMKLVFENYVSIILFIINISLFKYKCIWWKYNIIWIRRIIDDDIKLRRFD